MDSSKPIYRLKGGDYREILELEVSVGRYVAVGHRARLGPFFEQGHDICEAQTVPIVRFQSKTWRTVADGTTVL